MRCLVLLLLAANVPNLSGTWKLNAGASDWNNKDRPKSVVLTGVIVENDERTNEFRFDGAIDGEEYPSDEGVRMLRRANDRTIESAWKSSDGRYSENSTTRVSRDGRRLTREIDLQRPDGRLKWTEVYDKQ